MNNDKIFVVALLLVLALLLAALGVSALNTRQVDAPVETLAYAEAPMDVMEVEALPVEYMLDAPEDVSEDVPAPPVPLPSEIPSALPEGARFDSDKYLSGRFIYEDFATRGLDAYWDFFDDGRVVVHFSEADLLSIIGRGVRSRPLVGQHYVLDQMVGVYIPAEAIQVFVHRLFDDYIIYHIFEQYEISFPHHADEIDITRRELAAVDGTSDMLFPYVDGIQAHILETFDLLQDTIDEHTAAVMDLFNHQFFIANEDFTQLSIAGANNTLIYYGDTNVPFPRFAAQGALYAAPLEQQVIDPGLLGRWIWGDDEYVTFHPDNTGTLVLQHIRWWVTEEQGLYICNTPSFCRGYCQNPVAWTYTLSPGRLSVASQELPHITFDYYQALPSPDLVGQWAWLGRLYYTFAPDFTGYMTTTQDPIRWWTTVDARLFVCTTPDTCGTRCNAPIIWDYVIDRGQDGDQLTLTGNLIPGMRLEYSRIP